jgi:hypothetical protein
MQLRYGAGNRFKGLTAAVAPQVTISRLEALAISIIAAGIFVLITWAAKGIWLWCGENLFLRLVARHIPRVEGTWRATFAAAGGAYSYEETIVLRQYGWKLSGHFVYRDTTSGASTMDLVKFFDLKGLLKGQILTAYYWGRDRALLGSGCLTLRLLDERTMEGGCIYYDPGSSKINCDMYRWVRSDV